MKKITDRSRYRLLGFALTVALVIAALTSPVRAVGDWTGCGDPYIREVEHCITIPTWWGSVPFSWCWDEQQGCADCDQGTACFALD